VQELFILLFNYHCIRTLCWDLAVITQLLQSWAETWPWV